MNRTKGLAHPGRVRVDDDRVDVIYRRFSSELQRTESNVDQERRCRDGLDRKGIDHSNFIVISDEAVSGESDVRPGFQRLKELLYSNRLGRLAVSEQSRLSRGDDAKALVKDIVFHGGRFISVMEGIDTDQTGWELLVGISELHHSHSNKDTAKRVRGGQEGRVSDGNGSAGDFPYGYRSEYADPSAVAAFRGRGPKPKKIVVIDEPQAAVVSEIFARFIALHSISSIVRWLNSIRDTIPSIGNRSGKGLWHHEHVRRILMNAKYIGQWVYGRTTTVRDRHGSKKQIRARHDQRITFAERPSLQIVDQSTWDAAQRRLKELLAVYGMKDGHRRRGPASHYRQLYQKKLLNGLIECHKCGSTMTDASSNGVKRFGCPKHRAGTCPFTARVPVAAAEKAILGVVEQVLTSYPGWLKGVVAEMRQATSDKLRQIPTEQQIVARERAAVQAEIDNLLSLAATGVKSQSLVDRLNAAEARRADLITKGERIGKLTPHEEFPDDAWVQEQFGDLAGLLRNMNPEGVRLLRELIRPIRAEEIKFPGKARGYVRLHFQLHAWPSLRQVLGRCLPKELLELVSSDSLHGEAGEEFVLDLGEPSRMDVWAPQIVAWREQGMTWREIVRRTGLKLANAYLAFKRYKDAGGKAA